MDDSKLFTGAFVSEMRKVFREAFDPVHEQLEKACKCLDRVEKTQVKLSHNDPNRRRRIQPRKYRVEDDWDPRIANTRYDGRFKEGRIQDNNNMCSIKKKTLLNDPEEWCKLEMTMEAYLEFNIMGNVKSSLNASSCESNQCKEEENEAISKLLLENEVESNSKPPLEDEEVQRKDIIQEQNIMHEAPKMVIDTRDIVIEKEENIQVKGLYSKLVEIEHIDSIGIDNFYINANYQLVNFFNELRKIELP
ncbi:hypothetical protein LguiB_005797 [Lonicera macranthoides]